METQTKVRRDSGIYEIDQAVALLDEAYTVMEDARRVRDEALLTRQGPERTVKVRELESTFGAGWRALVRARNAMEKAGVDTTRFDRLGEDLKAEHMLEPSLHDVSYLPDYGQVLGDGWKRLAEPTGIDAPTGTHDRNTSVMWRVHYGKSAIVATTLAATFGIASVASAIYEPFALVWTLTGFIPCAYWSARELKGWWKFRGLARRS